MPRTFEENLDLYAKLAVRHGANVQPGQELIVNADIADAHLVRRIVKEAYELGAKNVAVFYSDEANTVCRLEKGSEEAVSYAAKWLYDGLAEAFSSNAARLGVIGGNPALLKNIAPERVAASSKAQAIASRGVMEFISEFKVNWNLIGSASPEWAKLVFPGEPIDVAMAKLWDAIFSVSKVLEDDPLAAWSTHCDLLEKRKDWLNELQLTAVHFSGPGTDLTVGLADGAIWMGGWGYAKNGVRCAPNIPTEEVFTMPHRLRVNGVVSSTKPLSVRGQVVDGISVEFKDGAITAASASKGEDTFVKLIDTDEGGRRLGEVALVPHSCGVSRTNVLFYNTLYDENAACHIAQGRSYLENLGGGDQLSAEEQKEKGSNDSLIHVDWMIGSDHVDVVGHRADGTKVALLSGGDWVTPV